MSQKDKFPEPHVEKMPWYDSAALILLLSLLLWAIGTFGFIWFLGTIHPSSS